MRGKLFRKENGKCVDQMLYVRMIIRKMLAKDKKVYATFID